MGPKIQRGHSFSLSFLIMRKYFRLTLVLVASVSCILMLFYQQKYSKLNVIYNMMNAFGSNYAESNCNRKLQELSRVSKLDWVTVETMSGGLAWTEIFPHVYTYSTFWLSNSTHTFAFVDDVTAAGVEKLSCSLLFSSKKMPDPGKITVQLFQKNKNSLFVFIKCMPLDDLSENPFGVLFSRSNASSRIALPIVHEVAYISKFSMCTEPLPPGFNDLHRTIEFLVYHHHLGVNHFILYDKGVSVSVKKLLLELAPKCNIFVTLLPWNVPFAFDKSTRFGNEYFVDCVYRVVSRNYSTFIIKSDIDHFVVLREKRNLTTLMSDESFIDNPPRFHEEKFCAEFPDDPIAHHLNMPFITLLKNKLFQAADNDVRSMIYNVEKLRELMDSSDFKVWLYKGFPQKSAVLPKHVGVINSYKSCDGSQNALGKNSVLDKYMWKYKNLLFKSRLYALAKQSKLINDS